MSRWLERRGRVGQLCSHGKSTRPRILSPGRALACPVAYPPGYVSSLSLYFPFCKMELLIPALPRGIVQGATGATGWERPLETSLPGHRRQQPICSRITSPHWAGAATRPDKVF